MVLERYPQASVVDLDVLSYAADARNLEGVKGDCRFVKGDITDPDIVKDAMLDVDVVIHLAAESHVDRSIEDPSVFTRTNVMGTDTLLKGAMDADVERFIHVSTDEVYGSIPEGSFSEEDRLAPSSPYSASKAGSDLLAMAYHTTYGLPVSITRCTNNFGPYQHTEKLIPHFITSLLKGRQVPVYGSGKNVRDWIYVEDHCEAIDTVLRKGKAGEIYNIGGGNEMTNLDITYRILELLGRDRSMIRFTQDRKGHDMRYSVDCSKIKGLGWKPVNGFDEALSGTVNWYVKNRWWWDISES